MFTAPLGTQQDRRNPVSQTVGVIVCPKCGSEYDADRTGCGQCGAAKPKNAVVIERAAQVPTPTAAARVAAATKDAAGRVPASPVVLAGLEIPFGDLVILYIKLAFAAIPAALIIGLIVVTIRAVLNS
jgi:hypothetical protein